MEIDVAIPRENDGGFRTKFRPVGLEDAINRSGNEQVLFLPLAGGDTGTPYEAGNLPDFKATVSSAMKTLWSAFAIGRKAAASPAFDRRELWLAGHSAGNLSMWTCLSANSADVSRVISFDPSDSERVKNLDTGLPILKQAADRRKRLGRAFDLFVIATPNLSQHPAGLTAAIDLKIRQTGARVTVLPPFGSDYWKLPPTPATNAFLRYLLTNWSDGQLAASAKTPNKWFFLFFHEMAVFGGDLVPPPPQGAQASSSGASPPAPTIKTFFEQALGQPNPRPVP